MNITTVELNKGHSGYKQFMDMIFAESNNENSKKAILLYFENKSPINNAIKYEMVKVMTENVPNKENFMILSSREYDYTGIIGEEKKHIALVEQNSNATLIKPNRSPSEFLATLEEDNKYNYIFIDHLNAFMPTPIGEGKRIEELRRSALLNTLRDAATINGTRYIVANMTHSQIVDSSNNHMHIIVKHETDNGNSMLCLYDGRDQSKVIKIPFVITKKMPTESLLEDIETHTNGNKNMPERPRVNVGIVDKHIRKFDVRFGYTMPLVIYDKNGAPSSGLTQTTMKLILTRSDWHIPVLYISPFEKREEIRKSIMTIRKHTEIDKKSIERATIYSIENFSKEEELGSKEAINKVLKREFKTFSNKVGGKPFIAIIDLYDALMYNAHFDYNLIKILARANNAFTVVSMTDIKGRYAAVGDDSSNENILRLEKR